MVTEFSERLFEDQSIKL